MKAGEEKSQKVLSSTLSKKEKKSNKSKKTAISISNVQNLFETENKVASSSFKLLGKDISVFYIECLIDKKQLSSGLLSPLEKISQRTNLLKSSTLQPSKKSEDDEMQENSQNIVSILKEEIISLSSLESVENLTQIKEKIFDGAAVIVWNGGAVACPLFSPEKRSVTEPPNAKVIKGPREGFVEDLFTNTGLIRKRLKTENLKIIDLVVGKQTHSMVSIFYLDGIAQTDVVETVKKRISEINIDAIIDSYYIESFLETNKYKFFRRVGSTEKPDIFCAKILEGRVGILVDGSPIALTVPFVLFEDLQGAEDYYSIPAMATFTRVLRIIGLIFAILIPGIYVALQSYNYRILPINFLITLLSSIEGLSIPPLVEILIVLFLFEVITEASLRMPNPLSMALSIIGALALGNTAVDAGIISPPSIVVVAISSISLYIIPDQIEQTRILRVLFTAIGGIIGLYGIVVSFIILSSYLCSISSFGVPYTAPFAPYVKADSKDMFVKRSVQDMKTRPKLIVGKNKTRQGGDTHET